MSVLREVRIVRAAVCRWLQWRRVAVIAAGGLAGLATGLALGAWGPAVRLGADVVVPTAVPVVRCANAGIASPVASVLAPADRPLQAVEDDSP